MAFNIESKCLISKRSCYFSTLKILWNLLLYYRHSTKRLLSRIKLISWVHYEPILTGLWLKPIQIVHQRVSEYELLFLNCFDAMHCNLKNNLGKTRLDLPECWIPIVRYLLFTNCRHTYNSASTLHSNFMQFCQTCFIGN